MKTLFAVLCFFTVFAFAGRSEAQAQGANGPLAGFSAIIDAPQSPEPPQPPLTLDEIDRIALAENPEIHVAARKVAMAEAHVPTTGRLDDPQFMLRNWQVPLSKPWDLNASQNMLMLSQSLPGPGKRPLQTSIAQSEVTVAKDELESVRLRIRVEVRKAFFDLLLAQEEMRIHDQHVDIARQVIEAARIKYTVGKVPQQDVLKAQAEISMLKQRLYEMEQQEVVLKAKLNQLLNRRADAPLGLAVTEPQHEFEFQSEELFRLAEQMRPEIKKAQAEIQRNEAERSLMKKEFFPDYKLGAEYGYMNSGFTDFSGSDNVVMFRVGFELPIWQSKYRAGVREAEKMIESSRAGLEAAQRQTSYDVQDAYFKLETARRTSELYKTALLPQAEARFNASEAGYRTGKVEFLDLLESERFLLNARVMAAMAEGNVGMELGRLERAVGTDLKPNTRAQGVSQ